MTSQEPSQQNGAVAPAPEPTPVQPEAKQKKPIFKKWWFWVIIVVVVVAIAGGAAGSGNGGSNTAQPQDAVSADSAASSESGSANGDSAAPSDSNADDSAQADSDYTITDETFVDNGYGSYSITGTFTNATGRELSYVQVTYRMLDADGAQIGTALANTNNLPDGSAWKFDAMYFDSDVAPASYKFVEVTYF